MENSNTLKPLAELVLIGEIVNQSKFAALAADQLERTSDHIEVLASIQSILVAAANVSKILWPTKRYAARGKHLRERLNVPDDSPLSNRTMRNHFEHYDARIEGWFNNNNSAVYMDLRIDPREHAPWSLPQTFHRHYNPVTRELSFRGESMNLAVVLRALAEIRETCSLFALS